MLFATFDAALRDFAVTLAAVATVFAVMLVPILHVAKVKAKDVFRLVRFFHGAVAVPGISEAVASAPERLMNVEKFMSSATVELSKLNDKSDKQFTTMSDFMDVMRALNDRLVSIDKKVTGNGGDSNDMADVVQRMAKERGLWLADPKQH